MLFFFKKVLFHTCHYPINAVRNKIYVLKGLVIKHLLEMASNPLKAQSVNINYDNTKQHGCYDHRKSDSVN